MYSRRHGGAAALTRGDRFGRVRGSVRRQREQRLRDIAGAAPSHAARTIPPLVRGDPPVQQKRWVGTIPRVTRGVYFRERKNTQSLWVKNQLVNNPRGVAVQNQGLVKIPLQNHNIDHYHEKFARMTTMRIIMFDSNVFLVHRF